MECMMLTRVLYIDGGQKTSYVRHHWTLQRRETETDTTSRRNAPRELEALSPE